jgi:hypothetical protein
MSGICAGRVVIITGAWAGRTRWPSPGKAPG